MTTRGDIPARLQRATSELVELVQKFGQVRCTRYVGCRRSRPKKRAYALVEDVIDKLQNDPHLIKV